MGYRDDVNPVQEEAQAQKFPWRDPEAKSYKITMSSQQIPDSLDVVTDDILKQIIGCAHQGGCNDQCTTAFRIIPEELEMSKALRPVWFSLKCIRKPWFEPPPVSEQK